MRFPKEKVLFLSSVLLTAVMLLGVVMVSYDAMTIREAEEIEEDASKLLLNAEQWLNHQQEIEVAVRNYVYAGNQSSLTTIAENRRAAVEHERGMQAILDEYHQGKAEELTLGLLKFTARHQRLIDQIVAYKNAGDNASAQRSLASADRELFVYGARQIIDNIILDLQKKRSDANAQVSLNVLRGSISFGLMASLIIAIIWISYTTTHRTQQRNKELSEQLLLKATHDSLTRLPNRDLFYDRLSQSISVARRHRQRLAVLYLDLDGFKAVNDTYGHQVGDATLKEAARRLQASVRDADTVARLGGDEFAVVLTEIKGALDAGQVASKIIGNVAVPMSLYDGRTYQIGVSIGIAIYPDSGVEIDRLVKAADNAMYESKALGKNCFTYSVEHTVESPAADSWFGFVDDFLVGINVIDEQHQAMGDMLNKLNVALAMQEPLEALTQQFDELSAYAGFHFQTEERLMEQYRYPEVGAHKEEHLRLIGEMKYLKARFADGSELLVLQWIKDWLIGHISGADRRLSEYLMTRVER